MQAAHFSTGPQDHFSVGQLHEAGMLLAGGEMTSLLQDAFRCAWPGFAAELTIAVAQSVSSQVVALSKSGSIRVIRKNFDLQRRSDRCFKLFQSLSSSLCFLCDLLLAG